MVIENRKAYYDYFVEETLECGISLRGNEVKSICEGRASIKDAWIAIENGELLLKKAHVSAWDTANAFDVDETRERKLLAHKREIAELSRKSTVAGYTLIPLKLYVSNRKVKILVGICKGKHNYDKRAASKARDMERAARAYKEEE
jgi:SsrA-binding protein